ASLLEMLVNAHQLQQAVKVGSLGIKLHQNCPWIYYHLGQAFSALEHWKEALFCYKKAAEIQIDVPDIQDKINLAVEKLRQANKSIQTQKIAESNNNLNLEIKHNNAREKISHLQNQAVAKHKAGQAEEAIAFYLEAISLDHNQPAWIYGNAMTLLAETNSLDQGLQLAEKAAQFHPTSDEVYREIGLI
ncbi:MAG: hypothetical protein AB4372_38130, partial [Xenococcus sp. (in: cyanobacteria)]